ncbi:MAG TPA: hypothetical protein VHP35_02545 [Terriglobia bacterium]|nr:hypothetical protein [Terriglobia bacterium]
MDLDRLGLSAADRRHAIHCWRTIGIAILEATILDAILATLLGLLVELKLPNLKPLPYDKAVATSCCWFLARIAFNTLGSGCSISLAERS